MKKVLIFVTLIAALPNVGASSGHLLVDWTQPPVFSQALVGAPLSTLEGEAEKWAFLGYHPVRIHAYLAPVPQINGTTAIRTFYSAVWHKDENILTSSGEADLTEEQLDDRHYSKYKDHRLVSLCATQEDPSDSGTRRFSAVWLKEKTQYDDRLRLSDNVVGLADKAQEWAAEGYSLLELNGHLGHADQIRYSSVWVRDQRAFEYEVDLTAAEFNTANTTHRNQGLSLRDIGATPNKDGAIRYSGVWADDPALASQHRALNVAPPANWDSRAYPRDDFGDVLAFRRKNFRYDDITPFHDGAEHRTSYLLHKADLIDDTFVSNQTIPEFPLAFLENVITSYQDSEDEQIYLPGQPDTSRMRVSLFVQDLQNGNYIALNPHDHTYLSSVRKVLAGTALLHEMEELDDPDSDLPLELDSLLTLSPERYRDATSGDGTNSTRFSKTSVEGLFPPTLREYFRRMLRYSDNTGTDLISSLLGGNQRQMDLFHQKVGAVNFSEFNQKNQQERYLRAYPLSNRDILSPSTIRSHVLLDITVPDSASADPFVQDFPNDEQWANASELNWLSGVSLSVDDSVDHHMASLRQSMTAKTYGQFWWALAHGKLLDEVELGELLRRMGSGGFDPRVIPGSYAAGNNWNGTQKPWFDSFRSKDGATFRNFNRVGICFDFASTPSTFNNVTPRFAYVCFSEHHASGSFGSDRYDENSATPTNLRVIEQDLFGPLVHYAIEALLQMPDPPKLTPAVWGNCFARLPKDPASGAPDMFADFDGDGTQEILEMVFGTDPTLPMPLDPARNNLPQLTTRGDGTTVLRCRLSNLFLDNADDSILAYFEESDDLTRWSFAGYGESPDRPDTLELPLSDPARTTRFLRVKVLQQNPNPQ